jgi:hypothetical protein
MLSYWVYVLLGNNDTGKTTFQRKLVWYLCHQPKGWTEYKNFPSNRIHQVAHPRAARPFETLFVAGRSVQEFKKHSSVDDFFRHSFKDAHVCILSSHINPNDVQTAQRMIEYCHDEKYNVAGVFWSNSQSQATTQFARLGWDERLWIDNPKSANWERQVERLAMGFGDMLVARSYSN